MKNAVEHHFTGTTEPLTGTYASNKTMLGSLLRQATGANPEDKFISTKPTAMINIPEVAIAAQHLPHVIKWSSDIYWIFATASATASATRTITLFTFNSTTSTISYQGYITLSGTTITATKLSRSLRAFVYEHDTGTVSTSGSSTTITGASTAFQSEGISVGARIGFGTTDPTAVTTWYEITAIASDSSLTINAPVTLASSTPYVIEEIRIALGITASSLVIQGGLFLIKGLNYDTFTGGGTVIPQATTVDGIRASYLLKDAVFNGNQTATVTVTIATPAVMTLNSHGLEEGDIVCFTTTGALPTGLAASATTTLTRYYVRNPTANTFNLSTTLTGALVNTSGSQSGTHTIHHASSMLCATVTDGGFVSFTDHPVYMVTAATPDTTIIKYNIRAALTVGAYGSLPNISNGVTPSAYVLKTKTLAVIGTISQLNCGRIFTVNHGAAAGSESLYFCTTTRVYRCPVANITAASTNYFGDAGMLEVPPGGVATYSATANMSSVDYSNNIDRLFIPTAAGRFGTHVTQYNTSADNFDKTIGANLTRLKLATTQTGASDGLFPQATLTLWTIDGWMFAIPSTTTTGLNWLYIWPFGADAFYNSSTNQHVITPKLATTGASKLYHVYVDHQEYAGTYGLGFPVETYKLWYRTTGIDDNSGSWTEVPVGADMTSVLPDDYIQFKIAFDIMGELCVPTRIYSICCTYEDSSQDSHYQPSLSKSSTASKIFAWKQVSAWGTDIPDMRLRLYDASTEVELLNDTVNLSSYGTWEYSTSGTSWSPWSSPADNVGNFIRYTATGFGYSGVTVRALLTQA